MDQIVERLNRDACDLACDPEPTVRGLAGLFVIDDQQRLVEWSDTAATLLSVPTELALGRPCYEVIRGRDPFGRPICRPQCPAFRSLQRGRLLGGCSLVVHRDTAAPMRLRCELGTLPRPPGGAIGHVSEQSVPSVDTGSRVVADPGSGAPGIVHDLVALVAVTTSLSGPDLQQSLERTLDILREATGAESAELFLAEPTSQALLLTAYRGPFRSAFNQIVRFKLGEGFPGLATARREAILTSTLPEDLRYLRDRVVEKGYRSYLCVPLLDPEGVLGAICLGSRRLELDSEKIERLLTWAGAPIAIALRAGLLQARQCVSAGDVTLETGRSEPLDQLLQAVLRHTCHLIQADNGTLVVFDGASGGAVRRVTEGAAEAAMCRCLGGQNVMASCPALAENHGVALYGARRTWPRACQSGQCVGSVRYCVPLRVGNELVGMMELDYRQVQPSPPTRHLRVLLEVAAQAAGLVKQARDSFEQRRRVEAAFRPSSTLARSSPPAHSAIRMGQQDWTGEASTPSLQLRCFGPFELYQHGLLVPPEMFKRRKARLLLQALLVSAGSPVERDTLIELLWPEIDPALGASRLHVVVHALRKIVEPPEANGRWLVIRGDGGHYIFDPQIPYWLDIQEFRAALVLGHRAEASEDQIAAIGAYEAAAHLYRGDLLANEPYAEWSWLEREYLRETFLDTLHRLAALYIVRDELEQAIACYRRSLRADPLREDTQRRLMSCLWQAGHRDEALRQFDLFRDQLRQELDIAPLPETQQLAREIRNG